MELRPLGKTGMLVSPIGLGTVKLGRNTGVKYPGAFELPSDEQAADLLAAAAEMGVNLLDTAPAYGTSEERLGGLMARHGWLGGRGRWVVCTKAGEEFGAGSSFDFSPAAIEASVERSLSRLGTSWLDVVLLHSSGEDLWVIRESGALDALKGLRARGLVRAVGVSTKTPEGAIAAIDAACDVIMVTLNPRDRADLPAIAAAHERGTGVLVKKALLSGHTGEARQHLSEEERGAAGGDGASACVRFALGTPGVSSAIIGTLKADHLREAVRAAG